MKLTIKVKTFRNQVLPTIIDKGEWIDLRSANSYKLDKCKLATISLGVAMKLPDGFEAIVAPRSSTPKNFKMICANSFGIIDNSFSGNYDEWKFIAYTLQDTAIKKGDRICQFRIQLSQKATFWQKLKWFFSNGIQIKEVKELDAIDRGGIGSTGKN